MPVSPSFNPLDFVVGSIFPERLNVETTAWIGHVPFGMHCVNMTSPRIIVELGTHRGVSYCSFCQAVKELGLNTQCYAVDTWEGDAHSNSYSNQVYDDLKAYHDPRYSLFSKMIRSTFDDALAHFEDRSIDLLHIDGYHSYEAVRHDYETWLPKMSSRGVILFHDTNVRDQATFGVWRFWDEIKGNFPSFEFFHSHGLGVLAVGAEVPHSILRLASAPSSEMNRIRNYYAGQGAMLIKQGALMVENQKMASYQKQLDSQYSAVVQELGNLKNLFSKPEFRGLQMIRNLLKKVMGR